MRARKFGYRKTKQLRESGSETGSVLRNLANAYTNGARSCQLVFLGGHLICQKICLRRLVSRFPLSCSWFQ